MPQPLMGAPCVPQVGRQKVWILPELCQSVLGTFYMLYVFHHQEKWDVSFFFGGGADEHLDELTRDDFPPEMTSILSRGSSQQQSPPRPWPLP